MQSSLMHRAVLQQELFLIGAAKLSDPSLLSRLFRLEETKKQTVGKMGIIHLLTQVKFKEKKGRAESREQRAESRGEEDSDPIL